MKKIIILIFLISFGKLFPAFETDILINLASSISFPLMDSKTVKVNGSTEVKPEFSLQLGYQFPINRGLKGFSFLFDINAEQATIGVSYPGNQKVVNKESGINVGGGLAFKFIIGSANSLVPRDSVLGFTLGAKAMVFTPELILNQLPLIPFGKIFVEQRFFVSRNLAIVLGINVGYDFMMFSGNDVHQLFMGYYVTSYSYVNIGVSLGLHFGS